MLECIQRLHVGKDSGLKVKPSSSRLLDLVRIIIKCLSKCMRVLRQLFYTTWCVRKFLPGEITQSEI